jgi:hypothetical protein
MNTSLERRAQLIVVKKETNIPKAKARKEMYTEMGTERGILVSAMQGGEITVDNLIKLVTDNVIPAELGAQIVEELKKVKNLLGAVARGVNTLE